MSNLQPGLRHQAAFRNLFRILGALLFPTALVLLGLGFYRFVTMDLDTWDGGLPDGAPMFIVGMLLMPIGWMCLAAGFLGAASRYGAGETMPVVRDSYRYVTGDDGTGGPTGGSTGEPTTGPTGSTGSPGLG